MRTIPVISSLLGPLEDIISLQLLPALTGRSISDVERDLFSLPVRLGGLGICDPKSHSDAEFDSSVKITSALVALIVQQELTFSIDTLEAQRSAKCEVVRMKHRAHDEVAATLCQSLPVGLQRIVALSSEKGASSWLSALPVEEHGFALHKSAFRDALCLRYGWLPSGLPTQCVCGQGFSVDHSMNCPTGGYPTLRHNELRDFTAAILSEVCTDVCVEPPLQSLSLVKHSHTLLQIVRMEHDWMFQLLGSGVVTTNGLSLTLRCLIQLLRHTVLHQWLHCIGDLKRRNVGNMSRGLGRLRWAHLPH